MSFFPVILEFKILSILSSTKFKVSLQLHANKYPWRQIYACYKNNSNILGHISGAHPKIIDIWPKGPYHLS